jgi:hypothetical protein
MALLGNSGPNSHLFCVRKDNNIKGQIHVDIFIKQHMGIVISIACADAGQCCNHREGYRERKTTQMEALKKEAINVISKMPDTAEIDDIMYRLYVIDKVRKGREAVTQGDTVPAEELQKEIESW